VCDATLRIAENDAKLLIYFDPTVHNVRQQQNDTIALFERSHVFGSIQGRHV
jgi:hypothetical protein